MGTSENVLGNKNDRTEPSAAGWRSLAAALMLATLVIAAVAARPAHAGTSSPPPAGECSDFACEK